MAVEAEVEEEEEKAVGSRESRRVERCEGDWCWGPAAEDEPYEVEPSEMPGISAGG